MIRPALPKRLATRIQVGSAAALLIVGGLAGTVLYTLHRQDLIAQLQETTTSQGALLEQGLRHAMVGRDPEYLDQLIRRLGHEPGVERVLLLDRQGQVRFASDSALVGTQMSRSDPACMLCHRRAPAERGQSAVVAQSDGSHVLRNVNPIRNAPECHACHGSSARINGVLLVDHSLAGIDRRMRAEAFTFAGGTLAALIVLGAVLGWLLHRLVLKPVRRMRRAMAAVEQGDFGRSVIAVGGDEMSHLAEQYNRMAESLNDTMDLLKKREEYLAGILGSADDGMVVVDKDLRVVVANPAYLELCGKRMEEVVGHTCCFAPQCRDMPHGICPSFSVFKKAGSERVIRRIITENGIARTFEICASPLQVNGRIDQALEVWRDITERTRIEAEMAHSERLNAMGLLASGISHEINNPLATMATCLDGLKRRLEEDGLHEQTVGVIGRYLDIIQKEVYRCRDLTGKLVLLSQKSSHVRRPVDMNAAITETLSLLEFEFEHRGVKVDRSLCPDLPPIEGDEAGLRQVLLNIFLNALQAIGGQNAPQAPEGQNALQAIGGQNAPQATGGQNAPQAPEGQNDTATPPGGDGRRSGRIQVSSSRAESEEPAIRIVIADDGCGIEPVDLEHIFEPFYSARRDGRGTGLGLSVSNQIVHLHGGAIDIQSRPGEGTVATITLPLDGGSANEGPDLRTPR